MPRLAICRDMVGKGYGLFFCDRRWRIVGATHAPTLAEARQTAERYYPGLAAHWVDLGVTYRKAQAYMKRLRAEEGCCFCGKAPGEHDGPQFEAGTARICGACVKQLATDLAKVEDP